MAYGRRKAWENRALALVIANVLTLQVGSGERRSERRSGHRWLSPDALLAEMGVRLQ